MSELTIENLEKFVNDIKTDGMCNITDSQVESALIRLLACEKSAKNEVALPEALKYAEIYGRAFICVDRNGSVHAVDPSQITLTIFNEPANAQPVIPDEITSASAPEIFEIAADAERLGLRGTYASYAVGWNACRAEMLKAQPVSEPYKSAANDIIAERQRQISEEGWTPEHDDEHTNSELADAAATYAYYANDRRLTPPNMWPWSSEWWKQTTPRQNLVKAGALILAEIERMDRTAPAQESE